MNYFLEMDALEFIEQYMVSREEEMKENLWTMYCHYHPNFTKDNFMTFNDFADMWMGKGKNNNTKRKNKSLSSNGKTEEQRIAEAENVLFKMEFMEKK